jgi:hypothetical protein
MRKVNVQNLCLLLFSSNWYVVILISLLDIHHSSCLLETTWTNGKTKNQDTGSIWRNFRTIAQCSLLVPDGSSIWFMFICYSVSGFEKSQRPRATRFREIPRWPGCIHVHSHASRHMLCLWVCITHMDIFRHNNDLSVKDKTSSSFSSI